MAITTTASLFAEELKTVNKNAEGVSQWEKFFLQPLQEAQSTAVSQISAQKNYDVSSAYANFQKQRQQSAQSPQLGTGFVEQTTGQLGEQYSSAFAQSSIKEQQKLSNVASGIQEALSDEQTRLLKQGKQYKSLYDKVLTAADLTSSDLIAEGYYDASGAITQKGQELFDRVLHTGDYQFGDTLAEKDPELYDFYVQNKGNVNEMFGGLSRDDFAYDKSDYLETILNERHFKLSQTLNDISNSEKFNIIQELTIKENALKGASNAEYEKYISSDFESYDEAEKYLYNILHTIKKSNKSAQQKASDSRLTGI